MAWGEEPGRVSSDYGSFDNRTLTTLFKATSTAGTLPRPLKAKSQLKLTCEPRPLQ